MMSGSTINKEMEAAYIVNPEVVSRPEEEEAILFHPDSGAVKLLNRTGVLIYRLLDGKKRLEEIAAMIVQEFEGVDQEDARQDVAEFVKNMRQEDFIYIVK